MQKIDSIKDEEVLYQYPPNFSKAQKHRKATLILKQTQSMSQQQILCCQCCGKVVGQYPQTKICYKVKDKFKYYGPGIPLYFLFFRATILILVICELVFGIYAFVSNLIGTDCFDPTICSSDSILNQWSLFNVINNLGLVIAQKWTIVTLTIILFFMIIGIQYFIFKKRQQLDEQTISPSDYAIMIRKIPKTAGQSEIRQMIANYNNKVLRPEERRAARNCEIEHVIMSFDMDQYLKVKKDNLDSFKQSVEKKSEFKPQNLPLMTKFTGTTVVVFKYEQSKDFFLHKYKNLDNLIHYIWWQYSPRSSEFKINRKSVAIQRAPQPDDIIWQNCGKTTCSILFRKGIFFVLTCAILAAGGGVQYGLLKWQQAIQNASNIYSVQVGFAIFKAAAVVLFNFLIERFLIITSTKQGIDTRTGLQTVLTIKMVYFKFFNTGIFVLLAHIFAELPELKQNKSAITFDIVFIMASNAIFHNITMFLVNKFQLRNKIPRFFAQHQKGVYTQTQVNKLYQAPTVKLFKNYAYIFKTVWLTAFFFPTVPIVIIFSLFGLGVNYLLQKYLFSGVYKAPPIISSRLNKEVLGLLKLTLFWMNLGSFLFHMFIADFIYDQVGTHLIYPHWVGFAISFIHILFPYSAFLKCKQIFWKENHPQKVNGLTYTQADEKFFQINYQTTNPKYIDKKHYLKYKDVWVVRKLKKLGGFIKNNFSGLPSINLKPESSKTLIQHNIESQQHLKYFQ